MDKGNKNFLFVISILAVAAGLYMYHPQGLHFLADDFIHIPESANNLLAQRNSLRPIGNISLHLDYLFSHKSALGYHITNLILHVINSFFVFLLARLLITKYDTTNSSKSILACITAIVFFVYPFHSEAVFWIIGRSGSLGTLFFLPALMLFLQREKHIGYFICSLMCFVLALLSYESSWIFPFVAIIVAFMDVKTNNLKKRKQIIYITALWLVFAALLALRFKVTGDFFTQYDTNSLLNFDLKKLASNFFRLFARTLIAPFAKTQLLLLYFLVAVLLLITLVFKFFRHRQPKQLFFLLSIFWLLSYLPYLSLGIDTHGVEGERYLYLPSVFFCFWLAYVLNRIFTMQWFLSIISIWLCINIFFLYQSRNYYVKGGLITNTTINEIGKLKNKKVIYLQNLPQYNKGAVVFRLGLEEAIQWLHPSFKSNIYIVSKDDSDEKIREHHPPIFHSIYAKDTATIVIKSFLEKDKTNKATYILKDTTGLQFNPSKDAWLYFTDTSLIITQ